MRLVIIIRSLRRCGGTHETIVPAIRIGGRDARWVVEGRAADLIGQGGPEVEMCVLTGGRVNARFMGATDTTHAWVKLWYTSWPSCSAPTIVGLMKPTYQYLTPLHF